MARYDVFRFPGADGYVLDCQADLLSYLDTRLIVPLLPEASTPKVMPQLTPVFQISGEPHVMATQLASAVSARLLKDPVASLDEHSHQIMAALDMLLTGC